MTCPKCGCKVTYQYDGWDDYSLDCEDYDRCSACGHIFWAEEGLLEDDDYYESLPKKRNEK